MSTGAESMPPRGCLECGKPIVHRRVTALYCSGKCRELHNARRRRQARCEEIDSGTQPVCVEKTGV